MCHLTGATPLYNVPGSPPIPSIVVLHTCTRTCASVTSLLLPSLMYFGCMFNQVLFHLCSYSSGHHRTIYPGCVNYSTLVTFW